MSRGTAITLRPAAMAHNASVARALAGDAEVFAMVKSDAYGHGTLRAAEAFAPVVDGFGVAVMDEARVLREAGYRQPVMLLQGVLSAAELEQAQRLNLEIILHSDWQVALLEHQASGLPLKVWLKVNTGMNRLGVPLEQVPVLVERLNSLPGVALAGLMTHFACADMAPDPMTEGQVAAVVALAGQLDLPFSSANSAALFRYPASLGCRVRPGIMLYGSSPVPGKSARELGLAVTHVVHAQIIAINLVSQGGTVGYGATWAAQRDSRIGVASIGYGDGYPRHAPSGTPVAVHGQRTSLVGRVSMDMVTLDLTDLPDVQVGDQVELWGDTVSIDEVAQACGTISYELFCQMTGRPVRVVDHSL